MSHTPGAEDSVALRKEPIIDPFFLMLERY